jgi:hypothetical protein
VPHKPFSSWAYYGGHSVFLGKHISTLSQAGGATKEKQTKKLGMSFVILTPSFAFCLEYKGKGKAI